MSKIKCKLIYHSLSPHLSQLYTGFFKLYKHGLIDLEQQCIKQAPIDNTKPQHLRNAGHAHLTAIINEKIKIHYDTHDAIEVDEDYLKACDFYFKRSFSQKYVATLPKKYQHKLFPLGLYYYLLPGQINHFSLQRAWNLKTSTKDFLLSLIDILDTKNIIKANPRPKQLEALPDYNAPPKVLFLVAAYDPYDNPERSAEKIAERIYINETRANCIKLLRQELGEQFLGGFIHKKFAQQHYPDLLVKDNEVTRKGNYLKALKSYPIGIATTGLHGSIGGKMGEYVSLSKAIVSERLNYQATGDFAEGKNYLGFDTPEECVTQSLKLMNDRNLRTELMTNNSVYYQTHLKPDVLILNTLVKSMAECELDSFDGSTLSNTNKIPNSLLFA